VLFEEGNARIAVQARWKAHGTGASVEQVRGDRLGNHASAGGDLVQIKVLQAVLDQQCDVTPP
jgi:hypothetical protein